MESVSMKQWIAGVIESLRSSKGKQQNLDEIVCSHEYLSCALNIAHSLAEQLSTVEEEERGYYKERSAPSHYSSSDNNDIPPTRENIDKSLSAYISVYCTTKGSEAAGELHNLTQQLSTTLLENDGNSHHKSIDYLDVRGATLNEDAVNKRPLSSLGSAFYELFSGGHCLAIAKSSSLESVGGNDELLGNNNPTKRRLRSSSSLDNNNLSQHIEGGKNTSSVEQLRIMGLPTSLCDLISNMLDCVNKDDAHGDFDETYEFISDIRDDLKLLMDSPELYLHDIDLGEAANVGLQFGSTLFGREAELQELNECYQRSISSSCEVAMICGLSGVGKSKLCEEFIRSVNEGGSIVLSGRCDKIQSQPLHAISSMFDEYCASLSAKDRSTAEKIAAALKEKLGDGIVSLVAAIPNLVHILGDNFNSKEFANDTAIDAQKRLRYLFSEFVGVISSSHDEPLVFFLDDCQWIDSASVALLNQIMIMTGSHNNVYGQGFFFGSYRDDEMSETHPFNLMLSSVDNLVGNKTTKIHLKSMSKGAVNELVSTALSLLPRITHPLAHILHHKTKGSPLFVKQVMMELYKQRLLYPSLSRRRWVWEADKIREMDIPENVASFIAKSFDGLPFEVLSALVVLSCFGASADVSLMKVLEREIEQSLIGPLDEAVTQSVLGKRNGQFCFMHDKLQEAAYSKMKPEERSLHHNRYGLALGFVALREQDDRLLLTAVAQINHGGTKAVIDEEQAVVVAKLNLDAGKKAMGMSDFFAAHSFFKHGISYLRRGHWDKHYDLSLELFNLAAKCALTNAEHDSLKMLTEQIMQNAKCFEDKFQAISVNVTFLNWSGSVPAAVELINSTLSTLGEALPSTNTLAITKQYLENTKTQLAVRSGDMLLSYPAMTNPSKILAVELLVKLYGALALCGDSAALPIISMKVIQMSLVYGMSPRSPAAFAKYGSWLATSQNEYEEGYRYAKLSLSLMRQIPSRAHDGSTMFWSSLTRLYVEPIQSSIVGYHDAYKAHMKSGNPYAVASAYTFNDLCLWSGKELNAVVIAMKDTMKESKYIKNVVVPKLTLPMLQVALRLIGHSDVPVPQQDSVTNDLGKSLKEDDITVSYAIHSLTTIFAKLFEFLIFRELNEARDATEKYFFLRRFESSSSTPSLFFRRFYSGLVSFWVAREMGDNKNKSWKWLGRGVECKDELVKLSVSASTWNFQNKAYLLQAEEQFCSRNFEMAETLYDAAISSSKIHKFVNEEALANELAGYFYLETGRRNRSLHYFSQAFEKYNEWGAVAKANTLTEYLSDENER